ncbi:MAG: hypothetical protein ACRCSK_08730 [Fusobacteriaceae bacterium]
MAKQMRPTLIREHNERVLAKRKLLLKNNKTTLAHSLKIYKEKQDEFHDSIMAFDLVKTQYEEAEKRVDRVKAELRNALDVYQSDKTEFEKSHAEVAKVLAEMSNNNMEETKQDFSWYSSNLVLFTLLIIAGLIVLGFTTMMF